MPNTQTDYLTPEEEMEDLFLAIRVIDFHLAKRNLASWDRSKKESHRKQHLARITEINKELQKKDVTCNTGTIECWGGD